MRLSKQPREPEYRAIDASRAADTKKKPFRAQLYSLVALLTVTLGLIAVGVLVNRRLPEGSESQFVLAGTNKAVVASAANKRGLPSRRDGAIGRAAEAVERREDCCGLQFNNQKRQDCCPTPEGPPVVVTTTSAVGPVTPTPTPTPVVVPSTTSAVSSVTLPPPPPPPPTTTTPMSSSSAAPTSSSTGSSSSISTSTSSSFASTSASSSTSTSIFISSSSSSLFSTSTSTSSSSSSSTFSSSSLSTSSFSTSRSLSSSSRLSSSSATSPASSTSAPTKISSAGTPTTSPLNTPTITTTGLEDTTTLVSTTTVDSSILDSSVIESSVLDSTTAEATPVTTTTVVSEDASEITTPVSVTSDTLTDPTPTGPPPGTSDTVISAVPNPSDSSVPVPSSNGGTLSVDPSIQTERLSDVRSGGTSLVGSTATDSVPTIPSGPSRTVPGTTLGQSQTPAVVATSPSPSIERAVQSGTPSTPSAPAASRTVSPLPSVSAPENSSVLDPSPVSGSLAISQAAVRPPASPAASDPSISQPTGSAPAPSGPVSPLSSVPLPSVAPSGSQGATPSPNTPSTPEPSAVPGSSGALSVPPSAQASQTAGSQLSPPATGALSGSVSGPSPSIQGLPTASLPVNIAEFPLSRSLSDSVSGASAASAASLTQAASNPASFLPSVPATVSNSVASESQGASASRIPAALFNSAAPSNPVVPSDSAAPSNSAPQSAVPLQTNDPSGIQASPSPAASQSDTLPTINTPEPSGTPRTDAATLSNPASIANPTSNSQQASETEAQSASASASETETTATESTASPTSDAPTESASATQTGATADQTPVPKIPSEEITDGKVSVTQAVIANFVPIVVGRLFTTALSVSYSQVAAFEPLRQLMTDSGASGAALSGSAITLAPLAASYLYADVASAFSVEAFAADATWCSGPSPRDLDAPCRPRVSVNRWAVDVVISGLAGVAASLVFVIGLWFKTPSRVAVDTTSIAGVARIVGHPEVEREFTTIPRDMSHTELAARLKDKRFALGTFRAEGGVDKYGLVPVERDGDGDGDGVGGRPRSLLQRLEISVVETRAGLPATPWTRRRVHVDVLFALFHLALLGLAVAALANVDNPRHVFSYSSRPETVGARVGICLVGILVSRYWAMVFADAQNFAPYARLHARPSKAEDTVVKRGYGVPLLAVVPLARMGYLVPAVVAVAALSAEFLVVAVSGLPWRPGQLRGEYLVCAVGCVAIVTLMLVAQGLVFYWRSTLPTLPRRPDSVASVMTYVAGTTMSRDFNTVSGLGTKTADRAIAEMGKRYGYGIKVGEDGRQRWVVDEVAMGYEGDRTRATAHDV